MPHSKLDQEPLFFYINPLKQKRVILGHWGRGLAPLCFFEGQLSFWDHFKRGRCFSPTFKLHFVPSYSHWRVHHIYVWVSCMIWYWSSSPLPLRKKQHNNHNHHHNSLEAKASWAIWINRTSAMDHSFADPHAVNVEPKATSSGENLQNAVEILCFL